MISMSQDFKYFFFEKIFGHFVLLVPFEIISRYSNIDGSHCFTEDVQWIIDKVFRETYGLNGFDTFFLHFYTQILDFAVFVVVFMVNDML